MGFFSKVKKLWGFDAATTTPAEAQTQAEQAVEAQDSAQAEAAVQPKPEPLPEPVVKPVVEPGAVTKAEPKSEPAELSQAWRDALAASLTSGRAKISEWLGILLTDSNSAGPELWARLRFLFATLGAPEAEAEAFITEFEAWARAISERTRSMAPYLLVRGRRCAMVRRNSSEWRFFCSG